MDILNTSEGLLPQFEFDSNVQLLKTGLEMALQSIRLVEIESVELGGVFGGSLNMVSKEFTEPAEFGLSAVLVAELKGLHGSRLVHDFESCIVPENIEDRAICLPQELEPWRNDSTICAVSRLFAGYSRQED